MQAAATSPAGNTYTAPVAPTREQASHAASQQENQGQERPPHPASQRRTRGKSGHHTQRADGRTRDNNASRSQQAGKTRTRARNASRSQHAAGKTRDKGGHRSQQAAGCIRRGHNPVHRAQMMCQHGRGSRPNKVHHAVEPPQQVEAHATKDQRRNHCNPHNGVVRCNAACAIRLVAQQAHSPTTTTTMTAIAPHQGTWVPLRVPKRVVASQKVTRQTTLTAMPACSTTQNWKMYFTTSTTTSRMRTRTRTTMTSTS